MLGNKMKKFTVLGLATLFACACVAAVASPAPWFKWRSKVNGSLVCSQTPLGPGWEKASPAFKDSHCTKLSPNQ
ncbi:hypothetical protein LP420_03010 [Massilia sp. B-10]|nr:hypothetical protein LP420_03010 [Massilia sp. B-10]